MKIVIPGGSGQVGGFLARHFEEQGHEIILLSRRPRTSAWRVVEWDGRTIGRWIDEIDGADVVVNLAGRSVNCRYGRRNRERILQSRIDSTRIVAEALRRAESPPATWLQASTATIYAHRYDAPNDEATGILGGDEQGVPETWRFSVDVARAWEKAAEEVDLPATRRVLLRSALMLSPDRGGVFDVLLGLVRMGLGGTQGDGRQFVSWIHEHDFCRAVDWLIDSDLAGPVNLASPNPVRNAEFMATLREAAGWRVGLPAANWVLELGAFFMRTETELILKSRRVVPRRLLDAGFTFDFPVLANAMRELTRRHRGTQEITAEFVKASQPA